MSQLTLMKGVGLGLNAFADAAEWQLRVDRVQLDDK